MLLQHDSPVLAQSLAPFIQGDSAQACLAVWLAVWLTDTERDERVGGVWFKRKGGIKGDIKYNCCYWDLRGNGGFRQEAGNCKVTLICVLNLPGGIFTFLHQYSPQVLRTKCALCTLSLNFYVNTMIRANSGSQYLKYYNKGFSHISSASLFLSFFNVTLNKH